MTVPSDLAELLFRALYPDRELLLMPGGLYGVQAKGGLLAADSLSGLSWMLASLSDGNSADAEMIADETDPLPFRPK